MIVRKEFIITLFYFVCNIHVHVNENCDFFYFSAE
jgi:hypothetical protein